MRPAGEISLALLQAAKELSQQGRGATLVELSEHARVGRGDASACLKNMRRSGRLEIVGERRVAYRNRPVAEYAPSDEVRQIQTQTDWRHLGTCMADWVR